MEKNEVVARLAESLKLDRKQAEAAVDAVIAELASPFVFRRPGEEVALLDNSCTNNCKEPKQAIQR
jgi:nucleoid DNA-binding protein